MQSLGLSTKVIAASLALAAFAVAIVAGLAAGNPPRTILVNAIVSLIACQALGLLIGALAERAVFDHLTAYKAMRPAPGAPGGAPGAPPQKNSALG